MYNAVEEEVPLFQKLKKGGHLQQTGTIYNIVIEDLKDHSCRVSAKSANRLRRRCRLIVFLFLSLAAILFSRAERVSLFINKDI